MELDKLRKDDKKIKMTTSLKDPIYHRSVLLHSHTISLKIVFYSLSFFIILWATCGNLVTTVEATHQSSTDMNGAVIYVDIGSWKNRTSYPRFLFYRDNIRRRLENGDTLPDSITSYARPSQTQQSAIHNSQSEQQSSSDTETTPITSVSSEGISEDALKAEDYYDDEDLFHGHIEVATRNNFETHDDESQINNANIAANANDQNKSIVFPKDRTNPFNRLQINPDELSETTSQPGTSILGPQMSQSQESANSLEIGNRENFSSHPDQELEQDEEENSSLHLWKDAVPTFDLTMKIIQLSNWKDENIVFSPLSIANVLSMILLGAKGETFEELSTLLDKHKNFNSSSEWDIQRYHQAFTKLNQFFKLSSGKGVDFTTASEVFIDKRLQINEKYTKELNTYYEAHLEAFDFGKDGEIFKDKINKWVREKTHNQIRSVLDEPPSPSTVMGIVNAIYFKGPWEFPFNERYSSLRDFRVKPKEKMKVQIMVNELKIPYIERELFRMATLPYKDNKTALFLVLPKGNDGINDLKKVEKVLTTQLLNDSIYHMNDTKVTVFLPKLKFSSNGQMKEILRSMGLSSLFSVGRSDLSGISNTKDLYLSSILHRAVVEINEKGTEASAVTVGTVDRIFEEPPIPFICDKPFIFFIYHVEADTIIFWGRVTRPESIPTS